jgi:uncharacterized membrane protein
MDWEGLAALGHVAAAVTALALGAVVVLRPKGVGAHRSLGIAYAAALVVLDAAALSVHREATFGPFHILAVISLLTLAVGITPLALGSRTPTALATHAYCMTCSYAALLAAGTGQLAATWARGGGPRLVLPAIFSVLLVSGVVIFSRVPRILAPMLAANSH